MFGVGKNKKRSRSFSKSIEYEEKPHTEVLEVADKSAELTYKQFSLYFRTYLLVKYYKELFKRIND